MHMCDFELRAERRRQDNDARRAVEGRIESKRGETKTRGTGKRRT